LPPRFFSNGIGGDTKVKVNYAIDIEHLHRDPHIWSDDSMEFNPVRVQNVEKIGFMAFGARPYICPAGTLFAPMMTGICVGSLIKGFPTSPMSVDNANRSDESETWMLVDRVGREVDLAS
jgi:hypothetical protein